MNQVWHIFTKDVRYLWPEIVQLLCLFCGLISIHAYRYATGAQHALLASGGNSGQRISELFLELLPVAWFVLIARSIHGEKLVGDTQFWITRPYRWTSLMAAKLLFLAVSIYPLFFAAQCMLLAEEGMSPQLHITQLLLDLVWATGAVLLPLVAIAAVTSSFAAMTFAVLGALLCLAVMLAAFSISSQNRITSPISLWITFALICAVSAAVVVLQFATRKSWLGRILLLALPVACCMVQWIAPDQLLMDRTHPRAAAQSFAPMQISIPPNYTSFSSHNVKSVHYGSASYNFGIPVDITGLEQGAGIVFDGIRATFQAPDGSQWTSPWEPLGSKFAGEPASSAPWRGDAHLTIPEWVHEKYKSTPLTVHLDLALSQIRSEEVAQFSPAAQEFTLPYFGVCRFTPPSHQNSSMSFSCRHTVWAPLVRANIEWKTEPCAEAQAGDASATQGNGQEHWENWMGSLEPNSMAMWLNPIQFGGTTGLGTSHSTKNGQAMCYESANLTIARYKKVRSFQTSLTIQNYRIPEMK